MFTGSDLWPGEGCPRRTASGCIRCPVCFRKLCWNLQVDPVEQCRKLKEFYGKSELKDEVDWCDRALELLK